MCNKGWGGEHVPNKAVERCRFQWLKVGAGVLGVGDVDVQPLGEHAVAQVDHVGDGVGQLLRVRTRKVVPLRRSKLNHKKKVAQMHHFS